MKKTGKRVKFRKGEKLRYIRLAVMILAIPVAKVLAVILPVL